MNAPRPRPEVGAEMPVVTSSGEHGRGAVPDVAVGLPFRQD